jgi:hypothetical protein
MVGTRSSQAFDLMTCAEPKCTLLRDVNSCMGRRAVGRERELEALDEMLGRARQTPERLSLVGHPGIGKTSLWLAGVQRAREQGFQVLVARPAEPEQPLAFSALSDLFADAHEEVSTLPVPQRRAIANAPRFRRVRLATVAGRAGPSFPTVSLGQGEPAFARHLPTNSPLFPENLSPAAAGRRFVRHICRKRLDLAQPHGSRPESRPEPFS